MVTFYLVVLVRVWSDLREFEVLKICSGKREGLVQKGSRKSEIGGWVEGVNLKQREGLGGIKG